MTTRLARAAGLLLVFGAPPASATVFCAGTTAQLQAALDTAASNGQDDVVRITSGTLLGGSVMVSSEPHDIRVSGGYNALCTQVTGTTFLDGEEVVRPLRIINDNGDIVVERISFTRGLSTNNRGGGLNLRSEGGDIRVELCHFVGNRADDRAGGLNASTVTGSLTIRNNLFYGNSAAAGGAVELFQSQGIAFVTSNTIYKNIADSGAPNVGGLALSGSATYGLYNNILWDNDFLGAYDLSVAQTAPHARVANDLGSVGGLGANPILQELELSVDPLFGLDFRLQLQSPLREAGVDEPFGGLSATDLAGEPRIIGAHVDIGAYENRDSVFADGFE